MASQVKTCHHIKANGTCCQSPALSNDDYCFFHTAQRHRIRRQRRAERKGVRTPLQLPLFEDAESIQISIGEVLNALVVGRIDHKTAGLLLFGLQTAASNIRQARFVVDADHDAFPSEFNDAENELLEKEIADDIEQDRRRQEEDIALMKKERDRYYAERPTAIAPLPDKKPVQSASHDAPSKNGAERAVGLSRK